MRICNGFPCALNALQLIKPGSIEKSRRVGRTWRRVNGELVPRFRPKAMLERSATADLFKNTLSRIPTVFGRLAYLASLRDPISGIYRHHGLSAIFGREESRKALSLSHWNVFRDWLNMPLEEKSQDLKVYLDELEDPADAVLRHWSQAQVYRGYMPTPVRAAEEELFVREFDVLIEVLNCPPTVR